MNNFINILIDNNIFILVEMLIQEKGNSYMNQYINCESKWIEVLSYCGGAVEGYLMEIKSIQILIELGELKLWLVYWIQ